MNAISLTEFKIRPEDVCEPLRHLDVMHVYLLMPEETQNVRGILNGVWRDVRSPLTRTFFFFSFYCTSLILKCRGMGLSHRETVGFSWEGVSHNMTFARP